MLQLRIRQIIPAAAHHPRPQTRAGGFLSHGGGRRNLSKAVNVLLYVGSSRSGSYVGARAGIRPGLGTVLSARRVTISQDAARLALANYLVQIAKDGVTEEGPLAAAGVLHLISLTDELPD